GTPDTVEELPGPIESLATEIDRLGPGATVAAASFVAYLVGSLSQDVFGRVLPIGLDLLAGLVPGDHYLRDFAGRSFMRLRDWLREFEDRPCSDYSHAAIAALAYL